MPSTQSASHRRDLQKAEDAADVRGCMQGLLRHVLDHNKHVQEAACSALATLEEQSTPEQLVPRLKVILETLAKACATYGRKNLRILYDAISTLAELVGEHLADPNLLRVYMPPLVAKWQSLADSDRDLLPLLECFTAIAPAIGETQLLFSSFPLRLDKVAAHLVRPLIQSLGSEAVRTVMAWMTHGCIPDDSWMTHGRMQGRNALSCQACHAAYRAADPCLLSVSWSAAILSHTLGRALMGRA